MSAGTRARCLTVLLVIWVTAVVTWVVWRTFGDSPPDIPNGTVAALTAVTALPGVVYGLFQWVRK